MMFKRFLLLAVLVAVLVIVPVTGAVMYCEMNNRMVTVGGGADYARS